MKLNYNFDIHSEMWKIQVKSLKIVENNNNNNNKIIINR